MSSFLSRVSQLDYQEISKFSIQNGSESNGQVQMSQTIHRGNILKTWLEINQAKKEATFDLEKIVLSGISLDVGCGQGDFIGLLAGALLPEQGKARVVGIDPARLDYGSPFTLAQAQEHLVSSPLSSRLSFSQSTLEDYLSSNPSPTDSQAYSTLFLVHSLYYLPSQSTLTSILSSARKSGVKSLCMAEWSLSTSLKTGEGSAVPHILSVLLQSISPKHEANVQTIFTPQMIRSCAQEAGWELVGEECITPEEGLKDGGWEVYGAREVVKAVSLEGGEKLQSVQAHSCALEASIPEGNVEDVRSMDVWCGVFKPSQ